MCSTREQNPVGVAWLRLAPKTPFPVKGKLLQGCEAVILRSSSCEISYRKMWFSHAANAWQHCFASMLSPPVDTIMLVGKFGTGKSFPFAARKTALLLLSHLKGPNCFILQMSLAFTRESLMHLQDQVVTELPVCSRSLSCQGLQEEMEEEVQGPATREIRPGGRRCTEYFWTLMSPHSPSLNPGGQQAFPCPQSVITSFAGTS